MAKVGKASLRQYISAAACIAATASSCLISLLLLPLKWHIMLRHHRYIIIIVAAAAGLAAVDAMAEKVLSNLAAGEATLAFKMA